jgi:hypothetical protein
LADETEKKPRRDDRGGGRPGIAHGQLDLVHQYYELCQRLIKVIDAIFENETARGRLGKNDLEWVERAWRIAVKAVGVDLNSAPVSMRAVLSSGVPQMVDGRPARTDADWGQGDGADVSPDVAAAIQAKSDLFLSVQSQGGKKK